MMRTSALESLAHESAMLEDVNNVYARDVVQRAAKGGVSASHEFANQDGAIPIPATFTIILGGEITKGASGMSVRLYSDYPWPSRFEGGPRNDFEREALAHLRQNPRQPYYRFEDIGGLPFVRYATARVMQAACVKCHNSHPESPKRDWKVGDVRGVLQIVRPLYREQAITDAGLRGTVLLMGIVFLALVFVSGLVLVLGKRHQKRPL
jgi:adenylate cyclase